MPTPHFPEPEIRRNKCLNAGINHRQTSRRLNGAPMEQQRRPRVGIGHFGRPLKSEMPLAVGELERQLIGCQHRFNGDSGSLNGLVGVPGAHYRPGTGQRFNPELPAVVQALWIGGDTRTQYEPVVGRLLRA